MLLQTVPPGYKQFLRSNSMHRQRQVTSVCPAVSERLPYFIVSDVFHNAAMEQNLFILCNIKLDCVPGVLACVGVFAHTRIYVNSGEEGGGGRGDGEGRRKLCHSCPHWRKDHTTVNAVQLGFTN